jgi:DNA-binding CsgD family transcriptional regulator
MGDQQDLCRPIQLENDFAAPKVLGDFYIARHRYLVICLEHPFDPFSDQNLNPFLKSLSASVVGQLSVNQQYCAIVEIKVDIEHNSAPEGHLDATTLLTVRELQVVNLVAKGHPNKQIAHQLHISAWTVSTHLRRIFAKLGVDNRAAMVYRCFSRLGTLS